MKVLSLNDYPQYRGMCHLDTSLFWDMDLSKFDYQRSKSFVVERVIEFGRYEDYFAAFDLYGGFEGFREIVKSVHYLSPIDMNFVCIKFDLKKEDLLCYTQKQLREQHLNS